MLQLEKCVKENSNIYLLNRKALNSTEKTCNKKDEEILIDVSKIYYS